VNLEKVEALLTIYQRFNSNKLANKKQKKLNPVNSKNKKRSPRGARLLICLPLADR
jgi:hypothetical protein